MLITMKFRNMKKAIEMLSLYQSHNDSAVNTYSVVRRYSVGGSSLSDLNHTCSNHSVVLRMRLNLQERDALKILDEYHLSHILMRSGFNEDHFVFREGKKF